MFFKFFRGRIVVTDSLPRMLYRVIRLFVFLTSPPRTEVIEFSSPISTDKTFVISLTSKSVLDPISDLNSYGIGSVVCNNSSFQISSGDAPPTKNGKTTLPDNSSVILDAPLTVIEFPARSFFTS